MRAAALDDVLSDAVDALEIILATAGMATFVSVAIAYYLRRYRGFELPYFEQAMTVYGGVVGLVTVISIWAYREIVPTSVELLHRSSSDDQA